MTGERKGGGTAGEVCSMERIYSVVMPTGDNNNTTLFSIALGPAHP